MLGSIAAMLTGGDREDVSPQAGRSVAPFVDHFLLIRTGPSADRTIELFRKNMSAADLTVVDFPGEYRSCAAGRNFCLSESRKLGSDWTWLVDTDMIIHPRGEDVRAFLDSTTADLVQIRYFDGSHIGQPFIFRTPAAGCWVGDPHEQWIGRGRRATLARCRFEEQPKSKVETDRKMVMIRDLLLADGPNLDPRQHFFLADAYDYLGPAYLAHYHWLECARATRNRLEAAWCYYRIAAAALRTGAYLDTITAAWEGAEIAPEFPEFPWLRAWAHYHLGLLESAIVSADYASALAPAQISTNRLGWCNCRAWYEGPADVRARCWDEMGEPEKALAERQDFAKLELERLNA